jgi:hypothetical protein
MLPDQELLAPRCSTCVCAELFCCTAVLVKVSKEQSQGQGQQMHANVANYWQVLAATLLIHNRRFHKPARCSGTGCPSQHVFAWLLLYFADSCNISCHTCVAESSYKACCAPFKTLSKTACICCCCFLQGLW